MSFHTDSGGFAFSNADCKICFDGSTWGTRLSQLSRMAGWVYIMTYSLPDIKYVEEQIARRPHKIKIICHSQFADKAESIAEKFPSVWVATHDEIHTKMLLIEPETVWVGSANFGHSGWKETMIGIHSPDVFSRSLHYFNEVWDESSCLKSGSVWKNLRVGQKVMHSFFGVGVVLKINLLDIRGTVADIAFPNIGVKKILMEYAPVEIAT